MELLLHTLLLYMLGFDPRELGKLTVSLLLTQLTFILWTLSFSDEAIEKFATTGVLDLLILQVSAALREKVVRVALETLQVGSRAC